MNARHRRPSLRRSLVVLLPVVLLSSLIPFASVSAAVTVTGAAGGGAISADTNSAGGSGVYTALTGPSITEGTAGELAADGSIDLLAPAGFEFAPASASAAPGGPGCFGMTLGAVTTSSTTVTIPITAASTLPCVISVSGLGVRPTSGSPLATGTITNTGTRGPGGSSNYGDLAEIVGAPVLSVTSGAIGNTTGGMTLTSSPSFHTGDISGNDRAGDSILLGIKAGTGSAGAVLTCDANPVSATAGGLAAFTGCRIDKAGAGYVLTASTGAASVDTNAFDITVGPPANLVFTAYPGTPSTRTLAPQPTVAVVDAGGNLIAADDSTVVTLAISGVPATFTCTGGLSKTVTAGSASFADCTQTTDGTYSLTATSSPVLTPITGPSFTIISNRAQKLAFCWGIGADCPSTPPTISSGTPFSAQPTIRLQDAIGNTIAADSTTVVTIAIASGTPTSGGPGTLTCSGGLSRTVSAGVATFSGCSIDKAGTGYRLRATASSSPSPAESVSFNVTVGPPTKLAFSAQPPTVASTGFPFPDPVKVAITDAGGTVVTGTVATIGLTIGNNPGGGTLGCAGGTSVATVNGVATFTGCAITGAGSGFTLVASASAATPVASLAPATSRSFNVSSSPAGIITITTSPGLNSATLPTAVIVWGKDVTLKVHIGGAGADRAVQLQVSKDQSTWSTISSLTTDASGDASYGYGPSDNRYYRAVFDGAEDLAAGTSPTIRVVVRSIILVRPANNGLVKTIRSGTVVVFTATARPNRPELPQPQADLVVYELTNGGWNKVVDQVLLVNRETGVVTVTLTFVATGKYYVRAQLVPTPVNANSGWSQVERFDVT